MNCISVLYFGVIGKIIAPFHVLHYASDEVAPETVSHEMKPPVQTYKLLVPLKTGAHALLHMLLTCGTGISCSPQKIRHDPPLIH